MIFAGFSGGKDSTAMVMLMAERGEQFTMLFTPTGDELPECMDHIHRIANLIDRPLMLASCPMDLYGLIRHWNALPNHRQRWCTRELKIQVAKKVLIDNPDSTLCVGLRADEMEREGMFGEHATYRYPLREAGMGIGDVVQFLADRGVKVPKRTDCALCFYQRIGEWYELWKEHPDSFQRGIEMEDATGHTFRSPSRDTWPASLAEMRKEFEAGRKPRKWERKLDVINEKPCRACSL